VLTALFLASALLTSAPVKASVLRCPVATEYSIRAEYARWLTAYRAHDIVETMAIFDSSVQFQFQGAPDQDFQALKSGYLSEFSTKSDVSWEPAWDQVLVSAQLAVAFATWRGIAKPNSEPSRIIAENRSVDTFIRGADCHWRIVRSLNYPIATASQRSAETNSPTIP
jgi:ketosteroid isomerase-like protein